MKNVIKLFAALMIVVAVNFAAKAQVSDDINVSAIVLAQLTIDGVTPLVFGNVSAETMPVINNITGETTNAGANATVGIFDVTGNNSSPIKAEFLPKITLNKSAGAGSVPSLEVFVTVSYLAGNREGAKFGGAAYTSGAIRDLSNSKGSFFVGGTLRATDGEAIIPDAIGNTYEGTFEMTVQYD